MASFPHYLQSQQRMDDEHAVKGRHTHRSICEVLPGNNFPIKIPQERNDERSDCGQENHLKPTKVFWKPFVPLSKHLLGLRKQLVLSEPGKKKTYHAHKIFWKIRNVINSVNFNVYALVAWLPGWRVSYNESYSKHDSHSSDSEKMWIQLEARRKPKRHSTTDVVYLSKEDRPVWARRIGAGRKMGNTLVDRVGQMIVSKWTQFWLLKLCYTVVSVLFRLKGVAVINPSESESESSGTCWVKFSQLLKKNGSDRPF